tara:strand:- start:4328 stop:4810 length:483 start_codon:yes stop_codon:yes gene_type:complete
MSKYRFLSLFWIIPAYLAFISFQQGMVHFGSKITFENGDRYIVEVLDMQMKQIAAQSNGFVIFKFTTPEDDVITKKMTLTIQMAQQIMKVSEIPIRYRKGGYPEIVLEPTYDIQYATSLYNMWVAIAALISTIIAALMIQRFSNAKSKTGTEVLHLERID